jgi:hypothetical protein
MLHKGETFTAKKKKKERKKKKTPAMGEGGQRRPFESTGNV